MLCDECGKREATVHIMQIGPDGRTEKKLCTVCAEKIGKWVCEPIQFNQGIVANEFLQNIFRGTEEKKPTEEETELVCPECGMRYVDFQKEGMLGCPKCYVAFQKQLEPMLRRMHGLSIHNGKLPRTNSGGESGTGVLELRARLQEAIENEEYEKAAEYRDLLRDIERREREGRHGE